MPHRQPPPDGLLRLRPPTVTDAEKPLRRQVAMAYRTAREAMLSHEAGGDCLFRAPPEALADRLGASARDLIYSSDAGGAACSFCRAKPLARIRDRAR
jgi:hypothetical protein